MKYFLDTEFIEDGTTIDLLSIALVCEDGRSFYRQNAGAKFTHASDWVWRNVFPHLEHFNMQGHRSCLEQTTSSLGDKKTPCGSDCPWREKWGIRDEIREFINQGNPEIWGYYADYDWVAFCQLFGSMIDLPKDYPMYCLDIKQWCDSLGNPKLPKQEGEHSALKDAQWNKLAWEFLNTLQTENH